MILWNMNAQKTPNLKNRKDLPWMLTKMLQAASSAIAKSACFRSLASSANFGDAQWCLEKPE